MQVVLGHAAEFLQANASNLDLDNNTPYYAFKWLQLADAACLTEACKACADRIIELNRSSCTAETLEGLSRQTLVYMVGSLAANTRHCRGCGDSSRCMLYCNKCKKCTCLA
jgi:hypothetical protein